MFSGIIHLRMRYNEREGLLIHNYRKKFKMSFLNQLNFSKLFHSGNKIHIAITPSKTSFSTVLPEQRLDQNKTFVVQKGLKYQKVHETEKLEYNALREARRQYILENSNRSRLAVTV